MWLNDVSCVADLIQLWFANVLGMLMLAVAIVRCYRVVSQREVLLPPKAGHAIIVGILLLSGISELLQKMFMESYRYLLTIPWILSTATSAIIAYLTAFILLTLSKGGNTAMGSRNRDSIVGNIIVLTFLWLPNGVLQIIYHTQTSEWTFVPQHSIQLIFSLSFIFVQMDVFQCGFPSVCGKRIITHNSLPNTGSTTLPTSDGSVHLGLLLTPSVIAPVTSKLAWTSDTATATVPCSNNPRSASNCSVRNSTNRLQRSRMYSRHSRTTSETLNVWQLDKSWPILPCHLPQPRSVSFCYVTSDI